TIMVTSRNGCHPTPAHGQAAAPGGRAELGLARAPDAKLPDLRAVLGSDCPRVGAVPIYERCGALYLPPTAPARPQTGRGFCLRGARVTAGPMRPSSQAGGARMLLPGRRRARALMPALYREPRRRA